MTLTDIWKKLGKSEAGSDGSRDRAWPILLTTVVVMLIPATLKAQEEQRQAIRATALDDIMVTARRVMETLQEAPVSVSAFTVDAMELRAMARLDDVANFSPGLSFYPGPTSPSGSGAVFIRGVGQPDYVPQTDPGVGIYLDGVYLGRTVGNVLDLADIERIEVLRGPQGTLYGKNSVGGAINVITRRPSNEFEGRTSVKLGRFSRADASLMLSIPLIEDELAIKLSANTRNADGYMTRILQPGARQGGEDSRAFAVSVDWVRTDDFNAYVTFDYSKVDQEQPARHHIGELPGDSVSAYALAIPGGLSNYIPTEFFTNYATGGNIDRLEVWGVAGILTYELGNMTLKSITGYRTLDSFSDGDLDSTPFTVLEEADTIDQKQFSQELQATAALLNNRLQVIAGLYYFYENSRSILEPQLLSDLPVFPVPGAIDRFIPTMQKQRSYAAYFQGDYDLTNKLTATVGVRYTRDEKDARLASQLVASGFYTLAPTDYDASWSDFSPRFGLRYGFLEDFMVYASIAKGYKGGGFNGRANAPEVVGPFDNETVWAYEIGLKSELFDRRLRVNAAAYFNDYSDLQYAIIVPNPDTSVNPTPFLITTENAADAEIKGLELEVTALPAKGLNVGITLGLMDAEYTRLLPNVAGLTMADDLSGAPKLTYSAVVDYELALKGDTRLHLHADYSYRDEVNFTVNQNHPSLRQDVGLLNLRVALKMRDDSWTLAGGITNLTDKKYYATGNAPAGLGDIRGYLGRPRQWYAEAIYRF